MGAARPSTARWPPPGGHHRVPRDGRPWGHLPAFCSSHPTATASPRSMRSGPFRTYGHHFSTVRLGINVKVNLRLEAQEGLVALRHRLRGAAVVLVAHGDGVRPCAVRREPLEVARADLPDHTREVEARREAARVLGALAVLLRLEGQLVQPKDLGGRRLVELGGKVAECDRHVIDVGRTVEPNRRHGELGDGGGVGELSLLHGGLDLLVLNRRRVLGAVEQAQELG
mmetsp:Transcript_3660/g.7617  ORF Transcript_3660/g.7617 Transcript_3660/m.7617 type:complete len:227 (+) Transcript_3660:54-734(+)